MAKTSKKQLESIARLHREKTTTVLLRFSNEGDREILEKLNTVGNKVGYIRGLIRQDLEKNTH